MKFHAEYDENLGIAIMVTVPESESVMYFAYGDLRVREVGDDENETFPAGCATDIIVSMINNAFGSAGILEKDRE